MPKGTTKTQTLRDDPGRRWERAAAQHILAPAPDAGSEANPIGVDREKEVIQGCIVAQEGPFKTPGRGEFDLPALKTIVELMAASPNGLKCRLAHPDESNDGIGKFLGRVKNPRLDFIAERESRGALKTDRVACVRGDLYLDPSAHLADFDMAEWLMTACESDPDAISMSLVLMTDEEYRVNPDGTPQRDEEGDYLPPLWRPTALHAVDVVDTGDACDGILAARLSSEEIPQTVLWQGAALLDRQFAGKSREFVEARLLGFASRYLDRRYGLNQQSPLAEFAAEFDRALAEPDGPPDPPASHDGCRSAKGMHYEKQCRQCGKIISSCGCRDRHREARVIRMGTCDACQKAAAQQNSAQQPPAQTSPPAYDPASDPDRRLRRKRLEEIREGF